MHRSLFRLLTIALALLLASPAEAQYTRDAAANKKIDEAINTHYLGTDFNKAEGVLTGTVKACEEKCSPQTLAKAWMYVGIVRGSGKNDIAGAKEAFQTALALDPNVKLDAALATPETQAAFNETGGGGAVETPATPATPDAPAAPAPAGEGLTCTPEVTQIETRRNIPVECTSDEEVTNVELRYRTFGSETWKTIKMEKKGKSFRAQISCELTQTPGTLRIYVRARDASGDELGTWGSKNAPIELQLVDESSEDPPSFSDADPPERCAAKEICPPDFPGCESGKKSGGTLDWGASCGNSAECKAGLLCLEGVCETAPSCKTDADCPAGTCIDGKCGVEGGGGGATGPYKKLWFGLHVAQDIALVKGTQVCEDDRQTSENFACYVPGGGETPYSSEQFAQREPNASFGDIATGTVAATTRFLLSIDYAFTPNIMAGVRLGYAIRGGPPAGKVVTYQNGDETDEVIDEGTAFLPYHAEVRGTYWFGANALARKGLRPYVALGGGMAQVDARVVARVRDDLGEGDIEAWKKLGQGFAMLGGGAAFAFSPRFALQANLNLMYMLSASGLVIQPSLGAVMGF